MPNNQGAIYWIALVSVLFIGLIIGGVIVFFFRNMSITRQLRVAQRKAARTIAEAKDETKILINDAKQEADKIKISAENEYRQRFAELQRQENRLTSKTESLDHRLEGLEARDRNLTNKERESEAIRTEAISIKERQVKQLETIASMTTADAKEMLLERVESEAKEEIARRLRGWEARLKEEADKKSQEILCQVIQRQASEISSETTVSTVPIPNDEMKGRLIGREGRNIRALEQATGVDLIIDDTPEAVTLSSFDPIRREVARITINKLILDGRIHPARIEELVAKAREEVDISIVKAGEQAAIEVGVQGLRPELIKVLGRLKYRTSYGQNVLDHSIESAYLCGMIAAELGANVVLAKRAGLLHDIGKAVDREVEGTHAQIGADLVKQWDKSVEVAQGIAEHHMEAGTTSFWGYIVSAADAISSARPGARRESLETYIKRLKALEEIANSFKGVEKSFAIQAGKEIRILVKPEEIDDLAAMRLARDIVKKIEEGLEYPGQVKVTVIRETRAVDYAK
ncbi:MAG: ribonuclease Y [Dehalococcoidales bacterium]|nr:ribonuclease Y [Dehalococcoidales bacterium]